MAEYLVQDESLTKIADEIRELSGTTNTMSLDAMATNVNEANTEIDEQESLLAEIANALTGKASSGSSTVKKLLYSANFTDLIASAHNNLDFGFKLVAGVQYEIHFDGTVYSLTCESLIQHAMLAFGNKHLANQDYPDTEEPFFIYQKDDTEQRQYLIVSTSGVHEIAIYTTITVNNGGSDILNGKKIIILGDSVNSGAGWDGGFANLFAEDFPNAIVNNASVSGAALTSSAIYYQLVEAFQAGFTPDYILLDGGGNDILNEVEPGTINPDEYADASSFSSTTIVGAFERFAINAQKYIPNAKIVFFNLYKLHPVATNVDYSTQREVWELLRQACKKYGIRYVDLWNEGNFTPYISEQFNTFMSDWIHINEAGYRRFWPLIKSALVTA